MKILTIPSPILTLPTKPIPVLDKRVVKLIKQMEQRLLVQKDPQGVGLAAPQVGQALQLFIIKPNKQAKTEVFINPKIIFASAAEDSILQPKGRRWRQEKDPNTRAGGQRRSSTSGNESATGGAAGKNKIPPQKLEGCLSIPRIWAPIKRARQIEIKYQNEQGVTQKKKFSGLKAIIIQHEIDHLNGILFTQRALEQKAQLYEEKANKLQKMSY